MVVGSCVSRNLGSSLPGKALTREAQGVRYARMLFPRKTATSYCTASTGFSVDADAGRAVPLFPDMEPPTCSRWPAKAAFLFGDPLLQQLIESRPVQRLRRIGFLGAVDRSQSSQSRNRHNRFDHSISVGAVGAALRQESKPISTRHSTSRGSRPTSRCWSRPALAHASSRSSKTDSVSRITMPAPRSFAEKRRWGRRYHTC